MRTFCVTILLGLLLAACAQSAPVSGGPGFVFGMAYMVVAALLVNSRREAR